MKNEKGDPEVRSVGLGLSDGNYVQITEGLSADETVLWEQSGFDSMNTPGGIRAQLAE